MFRSIVSSGVSFVVWISIGIVALLVTVAGAAGFAYFKYRQSQTGILYLYFLVYKFKKYI